MGDSSIAPRANDQDNFGFAFNDFDFSDRVLRLEIISDDESIDSCKKTDHTRKRKSENSESYNGTKVLFKNGMRESQQRNDVSLRISASEEATLMDLLNFMYENTLATSSTSGLMNLLILADKFEVTSCSRYVIQKLLKFHMSVENALVYLKLPPSILTSEIVKPLIDEAKNCVVARYKDLTTLKEEGILEVDLPLSALEVVLESKGLLVESEDDVFDLILKWARAHYPDPEERRETLTKRLARLICFHNMSSSKLKEVLACPEFVHEQGLNLVVEALFSKVEHNSLEPCGGQHLLTTEDPDYGFLGRVCWARSPIDRPRCVVYVDLRKDELERQDPSKYFSSQKFCVGGNHLYLTAGRHIQHDHFGLFVWKAKDTLTCTLDFEFAVKRKSTKEFESKLIINDCTFENSTIPGMGSRNLLRISWTDFMRDDCDYFIDDILHVRAEITVVNNS